MMARAGNGGDGGGEEQAKGARLVELKMTLPPAHPDVETRLQPQPAPVDEERL